MSHDLSRLKFKRLYRARERYDVPDILHTGDALHRPLESKPETGMRHGSETAKLQIPPVVIRVESVSGDPLLEFFIIRFTLASADDLAQPRHQDIHRPNGFIVLVHLHVEGLDLFRVVGYDHRPGVYFFRQKFFMLTLQIDSPGQREF